MPLFATQLVASARIASQIRGKTIVVFGASPDSLADRFLRTIAPAQPGLVVLGTRNPAHSQIVADALNTSNIPTKTFPIDMMSFTSVRTGAAAFLDGGWGGEEGVVVVNSAGLGGVDFKLSEDGHESQLQTSHLGSFLWINLVLPTLIKRSGKPVRVVNVTSEGYGFGPVRYYDPNFDEGKVYEKFVAYGQAKSAQILLSSALATRYAASGAVESFSIQPGYTPGTNLGKGIVRAPDALEKMVLALRRSGHPAGWDHPEPNPSDQNVANYVMAAFDPDIISQNGAYIRDSEIVNKDEMFPWAIEVRQEKRCWEWSERLIGQKFGWELS